MGKERSRGPSLAGALIALSLALLAGALQAEAPAPIFADGFESGDTGAWSSTLGVAGVRLVVIGDTGQGNAAQYCVAEGMSARCLAAGGCTAVLMAGDNFYDQGVDSTSDPQWVSKFEDAYDQPGLDDLPFYPVLGNHDYGPSSNGSKEAQIDYSSLPVGNGVGERPSDKWTMPAAWYDVVLGGGLAHLFALDTQDTAGGMPADQPDDMAARVAASSATWKLVLGHYPRYTSGAHQTDLPILDLVLPSPGLFAFQQQVYCGADLFIAGHDHDRELIGAGQDPSCPDTRFLISGAGATIRDGGPLVSESLFFDDLVEGFVVLELTPSAMHVEMWDMDDEECTAPDLAYEATFER